MDTEKKRESTSHLKKETRVVALNHFPVTVSQGKKKRKECFFEIKAVQKKNMIIFATEKREAAHAASFMHIL